MASESFEISASNLDQIGKSAKDATRAVRDFIREARSSGMRSFGNVNFGRALLGTAVSPFSPYFGARTLASSGAFGNVGGGFGSMAPIIGGVIASLYAFRHAISITTAAVDRGSRLYQQAAMTARQPGRLAAAQLALAGIGIDPGTTNRLLLQAQFVSGRGASGSLSNMLLRSAGGAGDVGTMQQIRNMSKELDWMGRKTHIAALVLGDTAGAMQRISMQAEVMKFTWNAAIQSIIADNEGVIRGFLALGTALAYLARGLGAFVSIIPGFAQWNLIGEFVKRNAGGTGPGGQRIAGGSMQPLVSSQWQRLGFSFGNFPGLDYAKETAKNTRKIAEAVSKGRDFSTPLFNAHAGAPGFNMP